MKISLISKNIILNLLYQLTNMLVNFLIMPLILVNFGSNINGLIQTIRQILNYVAFLGAGIAESSMVSLYRPLAEKDNRAISAIVNISGKVFFRAGMLFSWVSLCVAFFYPLIVKSVLDFYSSVLLIIILCAATASEFFIIGKYRALFIADQRGYVVNVIQIIAALLSLMLTYILIDLGFNIIVVQLGVSLSYISRIFLILYYAKKMYPYLDKEVLDDDNAMSKRKPATIHQLAGIISFGSQITMISIFLGNEEASVYAVYSLIFAGINMLLTTLSSALTPSFGALIAKNEAVILNKAYRFYELTFYTISFSAYFVAYVIILPFISLYTANNLDNVVYTRPEVAILFVIMGLLNCIRTPGATLINAAGHYKETQSRAIIEMLICFFGQLALIKWLGIEGVLIASIAAYLYRTVDVVIYSNYHLLNSNIAFSILNITVCTLLIVIALWFILDFDINIKTYIECLYWAILLGVGMLLVIGLYQLIFNKKYLFFRGD